MVRGAGSEGSGGEREELTCGVGKQSEEAMCVLGPRRLSRWAISRLPNSRLSR
jgi:hypothetical protein